MKIDTRYLSVHPATQAWFKQREQCRTCAHVRHLSVRGVEIMRCSAVVHSDKRVRAAGKARGTRHDWKYCIDARADGGECGPDAALFE